MASSYKGVVFDADGTLLTSSHEVSAAMRTVCGELRAQGIWLSVASARPPVSVRRIGQLIGALGPFCALNGAVILAQDGTLTHRHPIPDQLARALTTRLRSDGRLSLSLYSGNDWYVPRIDSHVLAEARIVGFDPTLDPDLAASGGIEKIMVISEESLARELAGELATWSAGIVVARSNPNYVEITASGRDKAAGVEAMAQEVGLSMSEIVACGDGENDIRFVARSGYGIAMRHAPAALKAAANLVVGSNDDDTLPTALLALFAR